MSTVKCFGQLDHIDREIRRRLASTSAASKDPIAIMITQLSRDTALWEE